MSLNAKRYKAGAPPMKVNPRRTSIPDSAFTAEEYEERQKRIEERRFFCYSRSCMYCGMVVVSEKWETPDEFSQQRNDHPSNRDPVGTPKKYACNDTTACRRRRKKAEDD